MTKEVELAYGTGHLTFRVPEGNLLGSVDVSPAPGGGDPGEMVRRALSNPIGTPSLARVALERGAKSAVIVVNDITRPTPYNLILPPLIAELESAGIRDEGITLLVATGIHRGHTEEENVRLYGEEICSRFRVVNHDCDHDTAGVGFTSDGTPVEVNRLLIQSDLRITTGLINLHYFAGYSGGRKSICPGVASRRLISASHAMMVDDRCRLDNIEDNPVHKVMMEAAKSVGVDFIINVVTDPEGHLVDVVAGDVEAAWLKGVEVCRRISTISLPRPADIVVAGCGGFPKDINLYQAQKALDGAALAVKPGGTIILVAECREGLGEETFERWVNEAQSPDDIDRRLRERFELGGHKAYAICRLIKKAQVLVVSSLPDEVVRKCFLTPAASLDEALELALDRQGRGAGVLIMPHAGNVAVRIG